MSCGLGHLPNLELVGLDIEKPANQKFYSRQVRKKKVLCFPVGKQVTGNSASTAGHFRKIIYVFIYLLLFSFGNVEILRRNVETITRTNNYSYKKGLVCQNMCF